MMTQPPGIDWDRLYREHRDAVLSSLRKRPPEPVARQFDAEDFFQEAAIYLFQNKRAKFDSWNHIIRWMTHVARMKMIDTCRKHIFRKNKLTTCSLDKVAEHESREPGPDLIAEARDTLEELGRRLKEDERAFLIMKAEGESTPEAARTVGWTDRKGQRFIARLRASLQ